MFFLVSLITVALLCTTATAEGGLLQSVPVADAERTIAERVFASLTPSLDDTTFQNCGLGAPLSFGGDTGRESDVKITCSPEGLITGIYLSRLETEGSIPPSISELKELSFLSISNSAIGGILPASLGDCSELVLLDLSNNQFTGNIPESLSKLKKLQTLRLEHNRLSGEIPPDLVTANDALHTCVLYERGGDKDNCFACPLPSVVAAKCLGSRGAVRWHHDPCLLETESCDESLSERTENEPATVAFIIGLIALIFALIALSVAVWTLYMGNRRLRAQVAQAKEAAANAQIAAAAAAESASSSNTPLPTSSTLRRRSSSSALSSSHSRKHERPESKRNEVSPWAGEKRTSSGTMTLTGTQMMDFKTQSSEDRESSGKRTGKYRSNSNPYERMEKDNSRREKRKSGGGGGGGGGDKIVSVAVYDRVSEPSTFLRASRDQRGAADESDNGMEESSPMMLTMQAMEDAKKAGFQVKRKSTADPESKDRNSYTLTAAADTDQSREGAGYARIVLRDGTSTIVNNPYGAVPGSSVAYEGINDAIDDGNGKRRGTGASEAKPVYDRVTSGRRGTGDGAASAPIPIPAPTYDVLRIRKPTNASSNQSQGGDPSKQSVSSEQQRKSGDKTRSSRKLSPRGSSRRQLSPNSSSRRQLALPRTGDEDGSDSGKGARKKRSARSPRGPAAASAQEVTYSHLSAISSVSSDPSRQMVAKMGTTSGELPSVKK